MKDWKYILYLAAAFGIFLLIKMFSPKQFSWQITFAPEDKNPYGAYALNELLPSVFPNAVIEPSYQTIYEIKDSLGRKGNILILSERFSPDESDTEALLRYVNDGGYAFISSQYFWGQFSDTLEFKSGNNFSFFEGDQGARDTSALYFVNTQYDSARKFRFRKDNVDTHFRSFNDSLSTVIARNGEGQVISIRIAHGKGAFILSTVPLVFANVNLLAGDNDVFASQLLSYLPPGDLQWSVYYQAGRREIESPLRFVLQTEPLRWAYFLGIGGLLLFMLIEIKRKQRMIPVVTPPANTTLEFVSTIGNLYYQNHEHKNIAEKKILFLLEQIRTRHMLSTARIDEGFIVALSKKSGRHVDEVRKLFRSIESIRGKSAITSDELIRFNREIEKFYRND